MKNFISLIIFLFVISFGGVSAQSSCSTALELVCGSSNWFPASSTNNFTKANYDFAACANTNWSYAGNDRLFFFNAGSTPRRVVFRLYNLKADLDLLVFRTCSGTTALSSCIALSCNPSTNAEEIVLENATGIYYIAVDGYAAGAGSSYDLDINCTNAPTYSTCDFDRTLTCGNSLWVDASTVNRFDASDYNLAACSGWTPDYKGMDHVYKIDVGVGKKDIEISMTGLNANLNLLLFKSCGSGKFSNCVATSTQSGKTNEKITIKDALGYYFLVVDGAEAWDKSGYELLMTCNTYSYPSYSCADATPLYCGDRKWVNASNSNKMTSENYDFTNCHPYSYGYTGNDHLYRLSTGAGQKEVTVTMSGLTRDLDLLLFKSCSETGSLLRLNQCVNFSIKSGNTNEVLTIHNASGDYYLAVDGFTTGVKSGYEIVVDCRTKSSFDCYDATTLRCGDSKWVQAASKNNLDKSSYNLNGCSGWGADYKGNDHLYRIDLGSGKKDVKIMLSDLNADLDLLLFRECAADWGSGILTPCIASSTKSGKSIEIIELNDANGVYYLSVDSNDPWAKSGYEIKLICTERPSYADCSTAVNLKCGDSKWVNAPTSNSIDHTNYDLANCGSSTYGYKGYDHLYRIDAGNGKRTLKIKMSGLSANLDLLLFRECGSYYGSRTNLSKCVASSRKSGKSNEAIEVNDASGIYYLVIDADDPWDRSGYEITVHCEDKPTYDCSQATLLKCGDSKWVNAPTTGHFSNANYELSGCSYTSKDYSGMDHFYRIEAGAGKKKLQIKMSGLTADMDLLLYRYCDIWSNKVQLKQCVAVSTKNNRSDEWIEIEEASGTYYLVVDAGDPWYKSGYEISVKCVEEPSYDCGHATPLQCGARKWINASQKNNLDEKNYSFAGCSSSSKLYKGNDHLYSVYVGNTKKTLKIKLTELSANLDLLVFQHCGSVSNKVQLKSCAGISSRSAKSDEEVIIENAVGTYYIVVDSNDPWDKSGYEISVDCHEPVQPLDCHSAIPLACGTNKWYDSPTKSSLNESNYDLSGCFNSSYSYKGFDHLYKIEVPTGKKQLTIKMSNLSADFDLLLFKKCVTTGGNVRFSSCAGYSKNLRKDSETITVNNAEGTYYLIVDSADPWAVSSYKLFVDCEDAVIDPDPIDPDPVDPTPEPSTCLSYKFNSADNLTFDLKKIIKESCSTNNRLTIFSTNAAGVINETGVEISIGADSTATYQGEMSTSEQRFVACFQSICEGESKMCCVAFSIDAILSCGGSVSGTTRGASSDFSREDILLCFETDLNYNGPDKLVMFEKTNVDDILMLNMTQSGGNLSLFILNEDLTPVDINCKAQNYNTTKQISNAGAVGEVYSDATNPLPAGRYYALIEGFTENVVGDYTLSLSCGIDCSEPTPITCFQDLSDESTKGLPDNQSMYLLGDTLLLVGYSGGERVYSFTITAASEARFTLKNLAADLDLFLVRGSCEEGEVIGSSRNVANLNEEIDISLSAGTYLVIVDGWHDSESDFELFSDFCDTSGAFVDQTASSRSNKLSQNVVLNEVVISPNPFSNNALFSVTMVKAALGKLMIYSVEGKILQTIPLQLNKGMNTIPLTSDQFGGTYGVMYYELITDQESITGKFIRTN